MKKILIIVIVILALAGGGFAVWKFLLGDGAESETAAAADHAGGPVYVDMAPFIIQVIRENGVVKNVSLSIKLEVAGPEAEMQVKDSIVYLRDAFLTRLHATFSRGAAGTNYDAAKLKRQLLAQADEILGPGAVTQVLIGSSIEQSTGP